MTGMSQGLFLDILDRGVTDARLRFAVGGRDLVVGRGAAGTGHHPEVTVPGENQRALTRTPPEGSLGLGESFMAGGFAVSEGSLAQLLEILLRIRLDRKIKASPWTALRVGLLRLADALRGKARNV